MSGIVGLVNGLGHCVGIWDIMCMSGIVWVALGIMWVVFGIVCVSGILCCHSGALYRWSGALCG